MYKFANISDAPCSQKVRGHTGAALVTAHAGPQLQILHWSVSDKAGHTVPALCSVMSASSGHGHPICGSNSCVQQMSGPQEC